MRIKKKYIIEGLHTEEDDKKLSDEIINSAKKLKERVKEAKKNGKNVASVKADRNEMYYHILDVIIGDDGKSIQLKGGISNNDKTITNPLLGSYDVTPENEHNKKFGFYALNIFNKVLDAVKYNEVLDLKKAHNNNSIEEADDEGGNDEGVIGGVEAAIIQTTNDLDILGIENPDDVATKLVSSKLNDMSESVRPSMTKGELIESVNDINKEIIKSSRKVIKTLKVKDLRNE